MQKILDTFCFLLIILITFVNDFLLFDIPFFYLLYFIILLLRFKYLRISKKEYLIQVFLSFVIFLPLLNEILYSESIYYHSYIFLVLYVNVFFLLVYFIKNKTSLVYNISLVLLFVFLIFSVIQISSTYSRPKLIFGPNVLYRLYGFLFFIIYAVDKFKSKNENLQNMDLIFILFIFVSILTGSRGAFVLIICSLIILIINKRLSSNFYKYTISIFLLIFTINYDLFHSIFWRVYFFDFDSNSISSRLSGIPIFIEYILNSSSITLLHGLSSNNYVFPTYPHNFLLESVVYSGIFFTMIFVISLGLCLFANHKLYIYFLPILIGSLFSGDLMYNFSFYTVSFSLSLLIIIRVYNELLSPN